MCVQVCVCECFLIVAANISSGASPSLSLPLSLAASQLMWFGRLACLYSVLLLLITKTLTGWLTPALSHWHSYLLPGWLKGQISVPLRLEQRGRTHGSVYILQWLLEFKDVFAHVCCGHGPCVQAQTLGCMRAVCVDWDTIQAAIYNWITALFRSQPSAWLDCLALFWPLNHGSHLRFVHLFKHVMCLMTANSTSWPIRDL